MGPDLGVLAGRLGSEDPDARGRALADLIERGGAATETLLDALRSPNTDVRALAAEGLSAIADPRSADRLASALHDTDGRVRAHAATGLANMRDARALDALVRTLGDVPDLLQFPLTLSTYSLARYGSAALPAVVPLLKSDDGATRTRAIWIVRQLVPPLLGDGDGWEEIWTALGRYDPDGPDRERDRAADLWAAWLEARGVAGSR